jgi:4-hydroxythreonine-4-phosphate dehydrogenase
VFVEERIMAANKAKIAIASGDPAGIGPEISLKTAFDPAVRAVCDTIVVCDPQLLQHHAKLCGIKADLHVVSRVGDARPDRVNVLDCTQPDMAPLGTTSAAAGRASIAFCARAIKAAVDGEVDAVVAAPQNETSVAMAGIKYDGHPSFLARETGTDEHNVYMMLCFGEMKITHCTLHQSVRDAIAAITPEKVARVLRVTDRTLRQLGITAPKIAVSGLNPHAGEGGLFGREEIEIIKPAIDAAVAEGLSVVGPFGADTFFHMRGIDAFVVMLHDQGHIAAKLLAPNATAALSIGGPILFSSVAHGSAHDIAGKGIADPKAMVDAVLRLSKAKRGAVASAA